MSSVMSEHISNPVKSISLSLTAQYAPSWKTWEGIRELVQNWHDGVLASFEESQLTGEKTAPKSKLTFVSCEESGSLVYKAIASAVTNYLPSEGVTNEDTSISQEFGRIVYSPVKEKLMLINCNTELMRKVLLLGFSKKAANKEVIGQFGEGLKIGSLALVREGRLVSLETRKDRWNFGLAHDDTFEEDVLTVFVSNRGTEDNEEHEKDSATVNLGQTDTCVTVFPLVLEDWELYLKRFLFLHPPSNYVRTKIGTLLIGDEYKGQLFVKGVWVSDLSKDGLASGVDFMHLKIDRDRRAVVHLSDIDHQVSSMWVHAIQQRPDLIGCYYSLLEQNNTCDVRHAQFYINKESAFLIAQQFFAVHGTMTYPVTNKVASDLLAEIKLEVHQKLVLCNEALLNVLHKSGMIEPLDAILSRSRASTKQSVIVPFADLTEDEVVVLRHVEKLVQLCRPEFNVVQMDITESEGKKILMKKCGHFEIPRALLKAKDHDGHMLGETCTGSASDLKTVCVQAAFIATKIVCLSGSLVRAGAGSYCDDGDDVVKLVASLASQVCAMNPPFCKDVHIEQQATLHSSDHSLFREREKLLQREKDLLNAKLLQKDQGHAQELLKLESKISLLEKELIHTQVNSSNVEQEINEHWAKTVEKMQLEMSKLRDAITDLERDKIFIKEKLTSTCEEIKQKEDIHSRNLYVLNGRCHSLRKLLAHKFEKLSQIMLASKETDVSVKKMLQTVSKEMEELTVERDKCIICIYEKANCVVIPCRHQITCLKCASLLEKCAYCRGPIRDKILTYGL